MTQDEHTQSPRVAVLAGATGLVGMALLAQLQTDGAYGRVIAPARRSLSVAQAGKLERVPLNAEIPGPVDTYFCALGTTQRRAGSRAAFRAIDVELVLELARRARAAGARTAVIVSSVGADARAPSFYLRCKGEMEASMRTLGFSALHLLRPSLLIGKRQESRPAEAFAQWVAPAYTGLLRGGLARYRPVSVDEVARQMRVAAAMSETGVRVHHRSSDGWEMPAA